jgi:hypothetical protein
MFVCANERGDHLLRDGDIELADDRAMKHPSLILRAAAAFRTEAEAIERCSKMREAGKLTERTGDLRPIRLSDFGKSANERWRVLLERHHAAHCFVSSDPDGI